ncbi:MAG TPA: hypothetical protein VF533_05205 [Solirubrobacteraceae bacterium]|jgi:hypothetical protein
MGAALAACALLPGAAPAAVPLPGGWPDRFEIGLASQPGTAAAIRRQAPLGFRYQYLTGGVDGANGWRHWNPGGSFATRYLQESERAGLRSVFTYYQLLPSRAARGGSEPDRDLANLRDRRTMRAYFRDLRLVLRKARRHEGVVLHVEPDLWGYVEQKARRGRASSVRAAVARSGDPALRGLPNHAGGFARAVVRLRDRIAPRVTLAYHLSTWGTGEDPTYSDPSPARVDALARKAARFYRSLHARFDLVFNDVDDRDAGFEEHVNGNPGALWDAGDFHRHAAFIAGFTRRAKRPVVLWQVPLGNSTLPDTWERYRDSRVEWWLGERRDEHLAEARDAGIVALLFGGGAEGTTSAETDGGLFWRSAAAYYRAPLPLHELK